MRPNLETSTSQSSDVEKSTQPISYLVRQLRKLSGLTQEQLAAKLGVSYVTVNRWENDRTQPSPLALRQLHTMLEDLQQSVAESQQPDRQKLLDDYFAER